jgi:hypothetical protein
MVHMTVGHRQKVTRLQVQSGGGNQNSHNRSHGEPKGLLYSYVAR